MLCAQGNYELNEDAAESNLKALCKAVGAS